jgi:hypothetical protein
MSVLLVRRGCCPYLRRVSLARISRIPKEKTGFPLEFTLAKAVIGSYDPCF